MDSRGVIALAAIICLTTVLGNGTVFWAIARPRNRDRLRTASNMLIANLAMADMLVGVFWLSSTTLMLHGLPRDLYGCISIFALSYLPLKVSVWGYLLVTIERFVSIGFPYMYQRLFSKSRMIKLTVGLWMLGLVYTVIPFIWNNGWPEGSQCRFVTVMNKTYMNYVDTLVFTLVPVALISAMYTYILVVTLRHIYQMRRQQSPPLSQEQDENLRWQQGVGLEVRAAWRCFLMIAVFACMQVIPRLLWAIQDINGVHWSKWNPMVVSFILLLNSTINPLLYTFTNRGLKAEVLRTLLFWKRNQVQGEPTPATVPVAPSASAAGEREQVSSNHNNRDQDSRHVPGAALREQARNSVSTEV